MHNMSAFFFWVLTPVDSRRFFWVYLREIAWLEFIIFGPLIGIDYAYCAWANRKYRAAVRDAGKPIREVPHEEPALVEATTLAGRREIEPPS